MTQGLGLIGEYLTCKYILACLVKFSAQKQSQKQKSYSKLRG